MAETRSSDLRLTRRREFIPLALGGGAAAALSVACSPPCLLGAPLEAEGRAPAWARRRLYGHVLPEFGLVSANRGSPLSAEELEGRRWLIALIDWQRAEDRLGAGLVLQVMQKARSDLREAGVSLVYARVAHPGARRARGELELTSFMVANQVSASEGGPLPLPPAYVEADPSRGRPRGDLERIGEAPNLLALDAKGVVRWHSAGAVPDPSGEIVLDMVYTTVEAVLFARDELSAPDGPAPGSRTAPASPASG